MIRLKLGLLSLPAVCLTVALAGCGGASGSPHQPQQFTLSATPSGVTIAQGGQGSSTIKITPQNGFSGSVTLSASGLPAGVTAAFTSNPASSASVLALTATTTATTGSATVTITGLSGNQTSTTTVSLTVNKQGQINHVVIILQENRTPDNLFQDPVLINAGADIQNYGYTTNGTKILLTPVSLGTTYDLGHSHDAFLQACQWTGSVCAMNGSNLISCSGSGCPQNASYQYVQASDVTPYYTMAETYAFGDRMFQTNQGPSFPAHQYILSGASSISATSTTYVADNPSNNTRADGTAGVGCLAPPSAVVNTLDTSQPFPNKDYGYVDGPECFDRPTLADVLTANGLTWKYYAAQDGSIWTAPDAIQEICLPTSGPPDQLTCNGTEWTSNVVLEGSGTQITTDITNGQLANVTWVIPAGQNSDHAGGNQVGGPSWVTSIVNSIGGSQFWADTVVIVTWDDWGGWYDHVAPTIRNSGSYPNSYEYGFRVPLIVISPYSKPKYISHQPNDFGSILKFIEEVFCPTNPAMCEINPSVGYADSYALGDLSDLLNFNQTPLQFAPIEAPLKTEYFLHDTSPPAPPDTD